MTSENEKAQLFAEEGIKLANLLGDSTAYYDISDNLAAIYSIQRKYDKSIELQERIMQYWHYNKNSNKEAEALTKLGSILINIEQNKKADSLFNIAESLYNQTKNISGLVDINLQRGLNFLNWDKFELAEQSFLTSQEMNVKLQDTKIESKLWNNLGIVARRKGDYDKALEYYLKALLNHEQNDLSKGKTLNNIGIIYKSLGEYEKALEYYKESLSIKEDLGLEKSISYSLHNIGTLYKSMLNYGEALKYLNRSLELKKQIEGYTGISKTINNLGNVYLEMGEYDKAENHFLNHLRVSQNRNDETESSEALNNLSILYLKKKNFQNAIKYGLQSLEIAERINYPKIMRSSSLSLSQSYNALNDTYKGLFYENKYWVINDSIFGYETRKEIAQLDHNYEIIKLEQKAVLEKENLKLFEVQKENDRLKIILLGFLLLVCSLLLALVFYKLSQNKNKFVGALNNWSLRLKNTVTKNEILEEKLALQKMKLDIQSKEIFNKTNKITDLESELSNDIKNEKNTLLNLNSFLNRNLQSEEDWNEFKHYFSAVHKDFFKILKSQYPNLTSYDLNLCAFIKLNLQNSEIALILGISPLSVKKARQRLFQKMKIENNKLMTNYIIQI